MKLKIKKIIIGMLITAHLQLSAQALYQSKVYSIYPDKVTQESFTAKVISPTEICSNYRSPEADNYSPTIQFKFSINSRDNEMISGKDHCVTLIPENSKCTTSLCFGERLNESKIISAGINLPENTIWTIRLDMRKVISSFDKKGFYTLYNGEKLVKADFKGVYIAGSSMPLIWDFNNLHTRPELELKDPDGDGIYETTLIMNNKQSEKQSEDHWKLSKNISAFPQYKSNQPVSDAIYNLASEEMIKAVEPDSTFRTGKEWAGVWTRDISYSIILSMAYLQPQVAKYSLMRKVKNNRIIQDTGTGGAYPVSTDRMIWAVAAWELFKVTGDKNWLKQAFQIIRNSIVEDLTNAYNPVTGMVKGESSFLDWREQTYPRWMQPADIYESECLGTNAVHYQANIVLSEMAALLNDNVTARKHRFIAHHIKSGINRYLWMPEKGYYAQYLYGRNYKSVSTRSEALGEALCVLFDVADKKQSEIIIRKTPQTEFGIPCIYPQIPGIPPYHNNAIWPFVQAYWALASAKSGNEQSVLKSIAAIYRPSVLFLTNKENFVAENGDFAGTQINSDNMLWSLSGNIALIHKLLFGIEFETEKLSFHPFVPQALAGIRSLTNFRYRNSILDIHMEGYGNNISQMLLDDEPLRKFELPANLIGKHKVKIILNNTHTPATLNQLSVTFTPETPIVQLSDNVLSWEAIQGVTTYRIYRNAKMEETIATNSFSVIKQGEYQIEAINNAGIASFLSEPVLFNINKNEYLVKEFVVQRNGLNNGQPKNFIEISKTQNNLINIPIQIKKAGRYSISMSYVNGNGPVNTENKCALRSIYINTKYSGTLVFPQRGKEEWSNVGLSNKILYTFKKGEQIISIYYETQNENMNGDINQAFVGKLFVMEI